MHTDLFQAPKEKTSMNKGRSQLALASCEPRAARRIIHASWCTCLWNPTEGQFSEEHLYNREQEYFEDPPIQIRSSAPLPCQLTLSETTWTCRISSLACIVSGRLKISRRLLDNRKLWTETEISSSISKEKVGRYLAARISSENIEDPNGTTKHMALLPATTRSLS